MKPPVFVVHNTAPAFGVSRGYRQQSLIAKQDLSDDTTTVCAQVLALQMRSNKKKTADKSVMCVYVDVFEDITRAGHDCAAR